ncbi:hypothetical protein C922_03999 [Plasmodium inui San Antonio 1]|uniref:Uncharacterized protein n=1 Tax=Plasmodium inui San Antonio 1 TaxID=1237626 RepID=W7A1D6_9APIC|nr:hypothetical protein C922_03999 [Plasmodium inui San Antonio 1]EUD65495.1 hypothetical protein C922_03999 [Plasmodium inui San Antonio 1]
MAYNRDSPYTLTFYESPPCDETQDDVDNDGEDFLTKESEIDQDPKPDENEAKEVDNLKKMLSFFQVVMVIVLLLRLGVSLK